MTAEEKILAYLDGSLSENESAELLHQLSVSPEKRVVLEQHIKLAELTRVAQKPFEVPLELEATLAKRLPITAASERIAPVAIRQGNGILTSALLLLRQYPVRFAIGALAILFSAAAIYSLSNTASTPSAPETAQTTLPTQTSATAPAATASSSNTTDPKNTIGNVTSNNSIASTPKVIGKTFSTTNLGNDLKNNQATSHSSQRIARSTINTNPTVPFKRGKQDNDRLIDHSVANNTISNTTVSNNSIGATSTTDAATTAISSVSEIPTAVVVSKPIAAVSQSEIRERYKYNPMEMNNIGERSPWTVRVSLGMLETFLNVPSGKNAYTARTEGSPYPSLGVNYSVSPSFAFGALLGYSSIMTVSPQTATTTDDGVNHVVAHTYSVNSREFFARAAARYSIGLSESWTAETSVEGGLLINSTSPMIAGQFLASHSLNDAFDIQFAALFSGVWTIPAAIQSGSIDPSNTNPTVYKTESLPGTTKIFSPAFTLRVGAQYRF